MAIESKLEPIVESGLEELEGLTPGTDEYRKVANDIEPLMDRALEFKKLEAETELKKQQMQEDKEDKKSKNRLTALSVVVPTAGMIAGVIYSNWIEFTKNELVTGNGLKSMLNGLLKGKK